MCRRVGRARPELLEWMTARAHLADPAGVHREGGDRHRDEGEVVVELLWTTPPRASYVPVTLSVVPLLRADGTAALSPQCRQTLLAAAGGPPPRLFGLGPQSKPAGEARARADSLAAATKPFSKRWQAGRTTVKGLQVKETSQLLSMASTALPDSLARRASTLPVPFFAFRIRSMRGVGA